MRFHRAFRELAFAAGAPFAQTARAETVVAARLEPVVRGGVSAALVDLHFRDGEERCVVPFVIVDLAMLEARERDPLVWPDCVRVGGFDAEGIADRIEPWLYELWSQRLMTAERRKAFGDACDGEMLEEASRRGFLGAATVEDVARRAAAYVYARRLARGRDVVIAARDGALGAALLQGARRIRLEREDPEGVRWYRPFLDENAQPDLLVVDAQAADSTARAGARTVVNLDGGDGLRIEPAPVVPVDSLFDFTQAVLRGERPFSVATTLDPPTRRPAIPERTPTGGSGGTIAFGLRAGALEFGGADVDLATTLAAALRDEGFTIELVDDPAAVDEMRPDLVHAFGLEDAAAAAAYARAARARDVPFALHPLCDAAPLGGFWGALVAPHCYRFGQDETTVAGLVALMSERRLAVNQIRADAPFAPQPQWEQNARAAVEAAGVVFVAGDAERGALAGLNLGGDTVPMAFPVAPSPAQMAPIGSLVGGEGYVLMHAPLEPSQNQLQAARAAERADLPLVIAGPVVDAGYAALVRAFAGPRVVVLGEPDPATAESLYRSAEVFLDASWVGRGLVRAV
ncbi:MAG: hypothetical protein JO101_13115, partial [Candidatus Eremiobacteraeota bacterium]|nr:hypothetical protein [Candidatus Eremiobacteraeota bacterium]